MSEEEARAWIRERFGVSRETALAHYSELLIAEAGNQNLVAASTLVTMWSRHLLDSAQLAPLAEGASAGPWLDIGSGAGLPGMVIAILLDRPVVLCEPRLRRIDFLTRTAAALGLVGKVTIQASKVENFRPTSPCAVVSARAVAELSQLLDSARHCTDLSTVWVLPKGLNARSEVAAARRRWHGVFHVEPSITQPDSGIVVARGVRPK